MTKRQAKSITLKVWRYLRDHPEIWFKEDLPPSLYLLIVNLADKCPLCEYNKAKPRCVGCPLVYGKKCYQYAKWCCADISDTDTRRKAAARIVELVEKW